MTDKLYTQAEVDILLQEQKEELLAEVEEQVEKSYAEAYEMIKMLVEERNQLRQGETAIKKKQKLPVADFFYEVAMKRSEEIQKGSESHESM